jgi:DNA mismatch repair protein MutH
VARVAWLPVQASPQLGLDRRRCGSALLWSPSPGDEATLRDDYQDIVELLSEGQRVTARTGAALQLRPKGRDARHLRRALDEEGAPARAAPRAFYLRRSFVDGLLNRHFAR